jgi:teichuronic acid biosynthesis protein TuaE
MQHNSIYYVSDVVNIHNWWMEILVSSGIFVFIAYVYIYTKNILHLYRIQKINTSEDVVYISMALYGFMISFIVASMSSSSQFASEWLWPCIALVYAFINYGYNSHLPYNTKQIIN